MLKAQQEPINKPKTWHDVVEMEKVPAHPGEPVEAEEDEFFKKYPPPSNNQVFVARWKDFIGTVARHKNFKELHLSQLGILCNLFVEVNRIEKYLEVNGYTYESGGRNGYQMKVNPIVNVLKSSRADIRVYSKMLGLLLNDDGESGNGSSGGNDDDFEL